MAATYRFKTVMVTDEARESFTELRDRAKEKWGDQFDIREFHDVVIGRGAMPLPVLTTQKVSPKLLFPR